MPQNGLHGPDWLRDQEIDQCTAGLATDGLLNSPATFRLEPASRPRETVHTVSERQAGDGGKSKQGLELHGGLSKKKEGGFWRAASLYIFAAPEGKAARFRGEKSRPRAIPRGPNCALHRCTSRASATFRGLRRGPGAQASHLLSTKCGATLKRFRSHVGMR